MPGEIIGQEVGRVLRSMLFSPGNQARKVEKALAEIPADAVIVDLEDAVPVGAKVETRSLVAASLSRPRQTRLFVRVNGVDTPWFFGDLDAVVQAGLDGVMLPKAAGAPAVYLADRYLAHLETSRGLVAGSIELMPLIESASGLANLKEICTSGIARLRRLGLGAIDFTADLGATVTPDETELLLVRSQMVLYSRVGGLEPPIDTVYAHFRDHAGFETSCRRARDLGFQGKTVIHPDQVTLANRIFAPTEDEIAWAEEVMTAFAEAEARGVAALQVRDQLIDYAFIIRARRILEQARG